jgi:hypothetical protein
MLPGTFTRQLESKLPGRTVQLRSKLPSLSALWYVDEMGICSTPFNASGHTNPPTQFLLSFVSYWHLILFSAHRRV